MDYSQSSRTPPIDRSVAAAVTKQSILNEEKNRYLDERAEDRYLGRKSPTYVLGTDYSEFYSRRSPAGINRSPRLSPTQRDMLNRVSPDLSLRHAPEGYVAINPRDNGSRSPKSMNRESYNDSRSPNSMNRSPKTTYGSDWSMRSPGGSVCGMKSAGGSEYRYRSPGGSYYDQPMSMSNRRKWNPPPVSMSTKYALPSTQRDNNMLY